MNEWKNMNWWISPDCHSPNISQILKDFSPHGVVVGVQVDFDHVVNRVLTPVVVFSRFVKVLQGFVGSTSEPEQQPRIQSLRAQ